MIVNGAVIADVHIGAVPTKVLRTELYKVFVPKLLKMPKLDIIAVSGDLLDHKLSFNSEDSKFAIELVQTILKVAKKKGAKVRILKGTKNHDLNQLNNFIYLESNPNYDFKIINTVSDEEIFPKVKALYLPEEYMDDPEKYYADFFSKKYDLCFFHGTFKHVGFHNESQESERPLKNAPVFEYEKMKDIVRGPIIGGHIHNADPYKDKIYYTRSFSRWCFGEEGDKGFRIFKYDSNSGKYNVGFVKNPLARTYNTLDINELFKDKTKTIDEKIAIIEATKRDEGIDFLRIKFDKTQVEEEAEVALIKEYFANNERENVKVAVSNLKKVQEDEDDNKLEEEYDFIFKKQYPLPKIVSEYLKKHDNIIISESTIDSILHDNTGKGD